MKKPGLLKLAEAGPVLSTRAKGREAADRVQDAVKDGGLVVSFVGVEIATPSFLDEVVMRIAALLRRNESLVVVIAGLSDEVRESLELVVDNRQLRLALLESDQITLLGGTSQLQETLEAAQNLGSFRAPDLAKELKVKLPSLHQRLSALLEAGAVTRKPDTTVKRGRRHAYKATTPDEVDPKKLEAVST
jgi:hypothetical protein